MQSRQRGVPFTPVAIVLDHLAGYNAYMDKPWGILPNTTGDREMRDLFDHQLFPGSDHIHNKPDPINPEISYLRPTPYGEIFDALLTSAPPGVLATYPEILLTGDIEFDEPFLKELEKALRQGSHVMISARNREKLGSRFDQLALMGKVELLEAWINPATGRSTAISNQRLAKLASEALPIEVTGDGVQYQINRTSKGWVVELINNSGVIKKPDQPAFIDPNATLKVRLKPKTPCQSATQWRTAKGFSRLDSIEVELGPGAIDFVEFIESNR